MSFQSRIEALIGLTNARNKRSRNDRRATKSSRRLGYEPLERREVMAASLFAATALSATAGYVDGMDIVNDSLGNTYIGGSIGNVNGIGTADFDPTNSYDDGRDIAGGGFVAKYSATGAFLWVRSMGDVVTQLEIGASGAIYFSGEVGNDYGYDLIAGKLDASGNSLWTKQFDLGAIDNPPEGMAVDETRNRVYLAGSQMLDNPGSQDGVVIALNTTNSSNVTVAWTARIDPTGNGHPLATCSDVIVDGAGYVYVGGTLRGSADFDPGSGKLIISSGSSGKSTPPGAGFVWKLTSTGGVVWAKAFVPSSDSFSSVTNLVTDGTNIYAGGHFRGSVDFQPDKTTLTLPNAGGYDAFVVKLTAATGVVNYAKSFGGSGDESVRGLLLDNLGNIYIAGMRSNPAGNGAFIAKFSVGTSQFTLQSQTNMLFTNGGYVWSQYLFGISRDPSTGRIHVVGSFTGSLDADGNGTTDLTADTATDQYDLFWVVLAL